MLHAEPKEQCLVKELLLASSCLLVEMGPTPYDLQAQGIMPCQRATAGLQLPVFRVMLHAELNEQCLVKELLLASSCLLLEMGPTPPAASCLHFV
ncbi:hypothetical protein RRG08_047374 [Elysia crispata]|uniref:Uncharacterized protein n=1 Tax=Elysia crispata TaxID=231223 RepID=A0AAE1CRY5_9GAST|nr:hypothetical protein RRG08_047374 [Elysia crispata]